MGFAAHFVNGALWVMSRPVLGLYLLELSLVMRDSQRAEFLADALAADVAGTEAAIALEEKQLLEPTFAATVQHAMQSERPDELLAEVAAAFTAVPQRERERRRRVARLEASRLSATHPPTAHRIRLLEERPRRDPRVVLTGERADAVQRDLDALAPRIGRRLVDEHRDRLYY
jgi:heat shock protein HtpX